MSLRQLERVFGGLPTHQAVPTQLSKRRLSPLVPVLHASLLSSSPEDKDDR